MSPGRQKVLVLGDDTRSFLACVRSLGRAGFSVHVAPNDWSSPALHSRYIQKMHRLPAYIGDGAAWLTVLRELLAEENFALVMPTSDPALLPLSIHRDQLSMYAKIAVPDARAIGTFFDKIATRELATDVAVPVARGMTLVPELVAEQVVKELGLPVVLKPAHSYEMVNLGQRQTVHFADSVEELRAFLAKPHPWPVLLERFFSGAGVGVSLLACEGRVLQYFQHVRHHEIAPEASGYRMSEPVDAAMAAACTRMMVKLNYTGLAMCEFKRNETTGEWILLEINARPWGSLPLPVSLGVDFPLAWARLLTDRTETVARTYAPGRFARNLQLDFWYFAAQLRRHRRQPVALIRFLLTSASEFFRFLVGVERSDTLVWDDPWPGYFEIMHIASRVIRKAFGRMARNPAPLMTSLCKRAVDGGRQPVRIEFVCKGNICRSPYAELLSRALFSANAGCAVEVSSSGTFTVEGRPSPTDAIAAAKRRTNIDLAHHHSRFFTEERASAADAIIVFDDENETRVLAHYPEVRKKLFWLTDFVKVPTRGVSVADPYGGDAKAYDHSCQMIEEGVAAMAKWFGVQADLPSAAMEAAGD